MSGALSVDQPPERDRARPATPGDDRGLSAKDADRFAESFRPSWRPSAPAKSAPPTAAANPRPSPRASQDQQDEDSEELASDLARLERTTHARRATVVAGAAIAGFAALAALGIMSSRWDESGEVPHASQANTTGAAHNATPSDTPIAAPSVAASTKPATKTAAHPAAHPAPAPGVPAAEPSGNTAAMAAAVDQAPGTNVSSDAPAANQGAPELPPAAEPPPSAFTQGAAEPGRAHEPVRGALLAANPQPASEPASEPGPSAKPVAEKTPEPAGEKPAAHASTNAKSERRARKAAKRRAPARIAEPPVKRVPAEVRVQVATSPAHASLFIGGRRVSNPYFGVAKGGGNLQVTARAPGYGRRELNVRLDRDRAIAITLPRLAGADRAPEPEPEKKPVEVRRLMEADDF